MKEGNVVRHHGLYRSEFEHDNCGIGAIVNIKGQKSHDTVANALKIVENLEHRAGKDAEGKTGDGVGILLQVSHRFFSKVCFMVKNIVNSALSDIPRHAFFLVFSYEVAIFTG